MNRNQNQTLKLLAIRYFPFLRHMVHKSNQAYINKNFDSYYFLASKKALSAEVSSPTLSFNPGSFDIEITNHCNINCRMCRTHASKRKPEHMTLGTYRTLISKVKDYGVRQLSLHTVGEPTVHPDIEEMIQMAHTNGIRCAVSTNANRPAKLKELYDHLWHLNGFRFSIDGIGDTYEHIRDGGKWDKVLESLGWIRDTNKGKHMGRIALTVDCILSMDTIGELATYMNTLSRYTFPKDIRFSVVNRLTPDPTYFDEAKLPGNVYRHSIPCAMPFGSMYFTNRGEATLCCRDYDGQLVIGDALKTDLGSLWRSAAAQKIRHLHLTGGIPQCQQCYMARPGISQALNARIHLMWHEGADDKGIERGVLKFLDRFK